MKNKINNLVKISLFLLLFCGIVFTGCEKDDYSPEEELMIKNSKEFEQYLIAHAKFVNVFQTQNVNSQNERPIKDNEHNTFQVNERTIYRNVYTGFDMSLFTDVLKARNELLNKHPNYSDLGTDVKMRLAEDVAVNSKKISQLFPSEYNKEQGIMQEPGIINLKTGNPENSSWAYGEGSFEQWIFELFDTWEDAFDACITWSLANDSVECGGYIWPDDSAILIIDTGAIVDSMALPVYQGMSATATFHLHPNNTPTMSTADSVAFQSMYQFGIQNMIILTNDSVYTYGPWW